MGAYTDGFHRLGQGEHHGIAFVDVMQRMYTATGTKGQRELADWLGVRQAFISDARRRNRIPVAWLRELVKRKVSCAPERVMTGKGLQFW